MSTVAVVGLGIMGGGAAQSLLRAGFAVRGCDVDAAMVDRFVAAGGTACTSPAEAARGAGTVVIVVMNADQTEQVLFGADGVLSTAAPGTAIVNCATVPPAYAAELGRRLAAAGMLPLDAPVSGGGAKAQAGTVTVIAAGAAKAFDVSGPALAAMSAQVFRLGETPGLGTQAKLINQLLGGVHNVATAEAMTLGIRLGLDPAMLAEVIEASAGNSFMFAQRAKRVAAGDYAQPSKLSIFVKDLHIVLAEAAARGFPVPLAEVATALYDAGAAAGLGDEDSIALAKVYAQRTGTTLPGVS